MTAMEKAIEESTDANREQFYSDLHELVDDQSALEKEYRALKLIQQTGQFPAELNSCFIISILSCVADLVTNCLMSGPSSLKQIYDRIMELEKKYQYVSDADNPSPSPLDLQVMHEAYETERRKVEAAVFRSYGEFDLADQQERNPEGYTKLKYADEEYFGPKGGDSR